MVLTLTGPTKILVHMLAYKEHNCLASFYK